LSNLIKVFTCPQCDTEENYYCHCQKCESRPRLKEKLRPKKTVEGSYIITGYVGTATNAEIVLQDTETKEEFYMSLNQFFPLIKGLKFDDLKLRERKQGSAYTWEVVKDKLEKGDK
jgi:hypothetical protein